ncbi:MAG: PilZ domain-containing protein [Terriglobales bacterium]
MPAEQRKAKRTKMVLPVKVSISGATHLAHTFDLTYVGARIGGLHAELKPDQIISLQRGSKKANFRVVWVQQLSPNEVQAGIQAVDMQSNFWGVDLSDQERAGGNVEALMSLMSAKKSEPKTL